MIKEYSALQLQAVNEPESTYSSQVNITMVSSDAAYLDGDYETSVKVTLPPPQKKCYHKACMVNLISIQKI